MWCRATNNAFIVVCALLAFATVGLSQSSSSSGDSYATENAAIQSVPYEIVDGEVRCPAGSVVYDYHGNVACLVVDTAALWGQLGGSDSEADTAAPQSCTDPLAEIVCIGSSCACGCVEGSEPESLWRADPLNGGKEELRCQIASNGVDMRSTNASLTGDYYVEPERLAVAAAAGLLLSCCAACCCGALSRRMCAAQSRDREDGRESRRSSMWGRSRQLLEALSNDPSLLMQARRKDSRLSRSSRDRLPEGGDHCA